MARAKRKGKSHLSIVFSTDNCSHSLNTPGQTCCFCLGLVPEGTGADHVVSERWVLPTYPAPTPPPGLNADQLAAWHRGIEHAERMTTEAAK